MNPNLTENFIREFINKDWNWQILSYNKNLSKNFIREFINKDWNWTALSHNQNLSKNCINKYRYYKIYINEYCKNIKIFKEGNIECIKNYNPYIIYYKI